MKKRIGAALVAVICMFLLAGCSRGPAEIAKPEPEEGATLFSVEGECTASINGDVLTVSGATNLMDGTNGVISVLNSDGTSASREKFTKDSDQISHDFKIEDDWTDIVYGFISFDTTQADKQSTEVKEAYGKKFENLEGDEENIIWDTKGVIAIFQSEAVEIRN